MSEELENLFLDAIDIFPETHREAAEKWFIEARAALEFIKELGVWPADGHQAPR